MGARANADGALPAGSGGGGSSALRNPTDGTGAAAQALKHNPGLSIEWSAEEQATLEEGLSKKHGLCLPCFYSRLTIAGFAVRDVAMRCRWMTKKENSKRRKEEHNLARKSKDKKERVSDTSAKALSYIGTRPNVPPYPPPMLPVDDDDISYKDIGGRTGELLESNAEAFSKISANFTNLKIQDNINLFCQTRDSILSVLKDLTDMPEIMKQMPALPVKLNEELANSILPRSNMPM